MKTRKELKEAYKEIKPVMGVFQIKNIKNGKTLVDCSIDIVSKMNRHRMELKFGSHQNRYLLNDWKEFGEDNFEFKILSEIKQKNDSDIDYNAEVTMLKELLLEELQLTTDFQY